MCLYMRMVCDTIVTTVPKSVVHCLVRKAEKNLLNHLFGFVHKMSPEELQRMLQVRGPGLPVPLSIALYLFPLQPRIALPVAVVQMYPNMICCVLLCAC